MERGYMTCKYPTCTNDVGQQDRDDYRDSRFCSIHCQTKYEHVKADAKDAERMERERANQQEDYF